MEELPHRGRNRYKQMTLGTFEFIRRFLIHMLPKGLHRIRHMVCSPKALASATSLAPVSCSPLQSPKASPVLLSIPASRLVHAAAAA